MTYQSLASYGSSFVENSRESNKIEDVKIKTKIFQTAYFSNFPLFVIKTIDM